MGTGATKTTKKRRGGETRLGPKTQKVLLLLQTGITLSLTARPDVMFKVIRETAREWKHIDQRTLQRAIRNLYRSKLVSWKEHSDGTIIAVLTNEGKQRALRYNLKTLSIEKPLQWDGWWRVVMFDIPERFKRGRDAFSVKLKELGFLQIQKSVFVFPHECKDELDFVIELFELRPFVRFLLVKEIDTGLDLKHRFSLR